MTPRRVRDRSSFPDPTPKHGSVTQAETGGVFAGRLNMDTNQLGVRPLMRSLFMFVLLFAVAACSTHSRTDAVRATPDESELSRLEKFGELPFGATVADCDFYALLEKKVDRGGARIDTLSPGSIAEIAGFQPGDCLRRIDEERILSGIHFASIVRDRSGQRVLISYIRSGSRNETHVTLGRVRLKPSPD